ncbi:hypothetical protein ACFWXA_13260 [Streptomyces atroolivaceus]|uniref:hypothetical protein n=1 Tax=Streptomyces atroolivaceus TaxID=66869 RepID=UPI00366385AD
MATTDSPPSGYQPSNQLRDSLAAWEKAVEETEPEAREALEAGIAQELRDDRQLSLNVLAQHLPFSAEMLRLLMANRDVPPRERHRQTEGGPPVYKPSDRLRDLRSAWYAAGDHVKKTRATLEASIADELKAHPALTNAEVAEHLPWSQEQVRVIARAHEVPRRRKRGSDHKLIEEKGAPKAVTVPYDWYVQQPGADPGITRR